MDSGVHPFNLFLYRKIRRLVACITALILCLALFPAKSRASVAGTTVTLTYDNFGSIGSDGPVPVGDGVEFDYTGISFNIDPANNRLTVYVAPAPDYFTEDIELTFSGGSFTGFSSITKNAALTTAQNAHLVTARVSGNSIFLDNTSNVQEVQNGYIVFDFSDAVLSSDAGLSTVLGQTVTAGIQAGTSAEPKTASVNVANTISSVSASDIIKHDAEAAVSFYGTDNTFTTPAAGSVSLTAGTGTVIYVKVTAQDGTMMYYAITVNRGADTQATPTFSPAAGAIAWGTQVTITSAGADHIYYTTDGSVPATAVGGATLEYTGPITINANTTIKAVAVKAGNIDSSVGTASYTQAATVDLTGLALSGNPVGFTFAGSTYSYNGVTVANGVSGITVTPTGTGIITVDGVTVASGQASASIALTPGVERTITVVATEAGKSSKTYTVKVTRSAALVIDAQDGGVSADGIATSVIVPALSQLGTGRVTLELIAESVTNGAGHPNITIAIQTLSANGRQLLAAYDIALMEYVYNTENGLVAQGEVPANRIIGGITVRLPLPAGYSSGDGLVVAYIDEAGMVVLLPTTTVQIDYVRYLQFTAAHFSVYAVIRTVNSYSPPTDNNPKAPQTGDDAFVFWYLIGAGVLAGAALLRRRKRT